MFYKVLAMSAVYGVSLIGGHSVQAMAVPEICPQVGIHLDTGPLYQRDRWQFYEPNAGPGSSLDWRLVPVKDQELSVITALNGALSIDGYKNSTPYLDARYQYRMGDWLFNIGGNSTGWSVVKAKLFTSSLGTDFQGRFRTTQRYRLNASIGYEFIPDWIFKVGYGSTYLPQKKGILKSYSNSSLANVNEARFRKSQHFLSLGIQGLF